MNCSSSDDHPPADQELTASFKALPALKPGTFEALISIVAPVCGLRPLRALRCFTEKVPKPTRETWSPLDRASVMLSTTASRARPADAFGRSAAVAMASISSVLFTLIPLEIVNRSGFKSPGMKYGFINPRALMFGRIAQPEKGCLKWSTEVDSDQCRVFQKYRSNRTHDFIPVVRFRSTQNLSVSAYLCDFFRLVRYPGRFPQQWRYNPRHSEVPALTPVLLPALRQSILQRG